MWTCPRCRRRFANRNQSHACGQNTLRDYLKGKDPYAISLFRQFSLLVRKCGAVKIETYKTGIGFKVRMAFAGVGLKRNWLDVGLVLARPLKNRRFSQVISFSPRNHLHRFRIRSSEELNGEVLSWLKESYKVGKQEHLSK